MPGLSGFSSFQDRPEVVPGTVVGTNRTVQLTSAAGGRETLTDAIEVTAAGVVNGESGGPAVDAAGNVVGMIEGGDPVKKNEYVIFSAHLDHIGLSAVPPGADNINNGADDDASGSTALLAIARAYAEGAEKGMRPQRSIIFLWNAGEEKGLWGSQYFAEFPPVEIKNVVANLNIDMIGRTKGPGYRSASPPPWA